ncbi:MAG: ABC transporter ATP-binding protein/permease [Solobacterium sp.]|jgi:ATP-binding cassette subfamily B protein|nr:ABC transporter ATP-binding protein/permease [Solobacterium sp.]MCH4206283.1 ABC transporter ATP-binding protein/permease [Solobacterium sp.]MCH4227749.1 ABC transporter ATP-binding protein/permease [Solobacterium sp.]MCH4283172.1 ABC transporter ATP-binding protein/permease [Solobacterium sp.]
MNFKETLHKLHHFLKMMKEDYPYIMPVILIYSFSSGIVPFWNLYFYASILNELCMQHYQSTVYAAALLVIGEFILNMIAAVTDAKITVYEQTASNSLARQVNDKAYVMEYDSYERQDSMDQIRRARNKANGAGGCEVIIESIKKLMQSMLSACCGIFFFGQMLWTLRGSLSMHDSIIWLLIVLFAGIIWFGFRISKDSMKLYEDMQQKNVHNNSLSAYLLTIAIDINNRKDIMMYHFQNIMSAYFKKTTKTFGMYLDYGRHYGKLAGFMAFMMNAFAAVSYIFVGVKALDGTIAIGSVLLYAGAIQMVTVRIKDMNDAYNDMSFRLDFVDDIYQYIHAPLMHYDGTLPIEKRNDNQYELEFKDVSFHYPGSSEYVLKHISLKFKVGEKLAIVGRNGAGKSTIVKLLCRLYEPTEGEILLNGININKYNYSEYTSIFAPVFQDFALFSLSVGENVACSEKYEAESADKALERVDVKKKVDHMKEGLDTLLYHNNGEGVDVSGGEAQKIAIARALYKDAPFVIFDEPTAALDPLAEAEIYENFDDLTHNKTSIYISHRMSSCKFCDRIAVFKKGEIAEIGTHDSLMKASGEYASLFNAQAVYYNEDEVKC